MDLHNDYRFYKIWSLSINSLKTAPYNNHLNYQLIHSIPIELQLILMSDGSFTQNLISLTGRMIDLNIVSKSTHKILNNSNHIREILLTDTTCKPLAFAQSIWPIYTNETQHNATLKNQPVGQSFIESKIEIYKEMHEIYYGYCTLLEKKFISDGPIWGRKYTIYHNQKPLTSIQEIFSPEIIDLFTYNI